MAYCEIDDLKTYLGIDTATDDVLLLSCIDRAQAAIDAHTGRTFEASADETRYLDAAADVDGRLLYVSAAGDLCAITSVTNGDSNVLAATDYVTDPRSRTPYYALRLLASSGISWSYTTDPENAITVVGKWAYSTTPNDDIVQACVRLAGWIYRQKDTTEDIDRPMLAGDGTVIMPTSLPNDVRGMLAPYRKIL